MSWRDDPFGPDSPAFGESGVLDRAPSAADAEDSFDEPESAHSEKPTAIVYVPSEPIPDQVSADTKVQLRYLADGTLTLPVFTSPDALVACCGSGQPWIGIPVETVEEFRRLVGADLAVIDPEAAPEEDA